MESRGLFFSSKVINLTTCYAGCLSITFTVVVFSLLSKGILLFMYYIFLLCFKYDLFTVYHSHHLKQHLINITIKHHLTIVVLIKLYFTCYFDNKKMILCHKWLIFSSSHIILRVIKKYLTIWKHMNYPNNPNKTYWGPV